jgi:hypothetical protein
MRPRVVFMAALAGAAPLVPAFGQELIGGYVAYIGDDDLYNSNGARLTEPWQILRQDRANFHRFGIRQRGDENDPFFSDANNRAAMEQMVRNGGITREARRLLLQGGATVYVDIYGRNGRGTSVDVTVSR